MAIKVVKPTSELVAVLGKTLRRADAAECVAMGCTPHQAIQRSVELSYIAAVALVNQEPAAIWGVADGEILGRVGRPWMLSAPPIEMEKYQAAKISRRFIAACLRRYDLLENFVAADYALSIRWLEWLGFTVEQERVKIGTGYWRRCWMERGE